MTTAASQVLKMFVEMGRDKLDLHVLFESAGNSPDARTGVLDAVEELKSAGLIEPLGGDFYRMTEKGKRENDRLARSSSASS